MNTPNIPAKASDSTAHPWRVLVAMGNHGLAGREPDAQEYADLQEPREIHFRRSVGRPLPGDLVDVDDSGSVTAILPRRNVFGRGVRGRFQPIASNLDSLLIVIAPQPAPSLALVDRYLAAARIQNIEPVLIVNKSDLSHPDEPPFDALDTLGCPVFHTQARGDGPIDALEAKLAGGMHLLAGQSGVGKSSLANRLLPDLALQTETLSRATGKGRHTTTQSRLFQTANGWLADTPGVWEYSLWRMPHATLARGFPEFQTLDACRFRDCRHAGEPGCAVEAAITAGALDSRRLDAWRRLLDEQTRLDADR